MESSPDQNFRLFGIATQVDLGNLAVGIATAMVAIVTLMISLQTSNTNNRNKIAEFRQAWVDDLRKALADISGLISITTNIAINHRHGSGSHDALDEKFGEIRRLESYIRLKLYRHDKIHRYIIELAFQLRGRLTLYAYTASSSVPPEITEISEMFIDLSQVLLKREWDRVTSEVLGRNKQSKLSEVWKKFRGQKTFEQETVEKVERFFHSINVKP